jgi:hypothetical protein
MYLQANATLRHGDDRAIKKRDQVWIGELVDRECEDDEDSGL